MNAVIASLEENLRHIKVVAEPTVPGFTKDRGNTGDYRELTVQQFIGNYLTSDYQIKKGSIFSKNATSNNIDCVILFPNHPKLNTPIREVIIAEGVYAAIEVKPDISTLTVNSEFHRALLQIQSVKQIERKRVQIDLSALGGRPKKSEYFDRIPGIIFSFKSQTLSNVIAYIKKVYQDKTISENEFPDIIISIDKGLLFYCPQIKETIFKQYLEHICSSYPDKVIVEIPEVGNSQLIWFLRIFLALPKPSLMLSGSILNEYLVIEGNENLKFHTLDDNDNFINKEVTTPKEEQPFN
ncbi:MAG: hypothetical protein JWQ25_2166 [Daejeonella sp.]|nr:hypothetical protein [Daejeonella sp.]